MQFIQESFEPVLLGPNSLRRQSPLSEQLRDFREFAKTTIVAQTVAQTFAGEEIRVPTYINEFWTARQRAANNLHEISYRACFKPQLPRFFIDRLTQPGELVFDPFMGRGTTLLEAALMGRVSAGCDVNPLSVILTAPRLRPPNLDEVAARLRQIDFTSEQRIPKDLLTFYHPETLQEICALKTYLSNRQAAGTADSIDQWITMVAVNRLTGHSPGFFSVYTLPPNQATSVKAQQKINRDRGQVPPRRHVAEIILRKSRGLLRDCDGDVRRTLAAVRSRHQLFTQNSANLPQLRSDSIALVVTSPPFLNVVDYAADNWLRCWFTGIDPASLKWTVPRKIEQWQEAMTAAFRELHRILRPGGHIAFEVGEVRGRTLKLEQNVLPCGIEAGLKPLLVLINDQRFTKTANCWGVDNNSKGTNTNRIAVFRKEG
jgi:hypothetical protein